ncbi:MAG TPA: hypothetical protein VGF13_17175 [Verrucomicrobiae bacterium]|jgi:hypothetical protein
MAKTHTPKRLPQANEPVTKETFARLPALLTRKQFQELTGLNDGDIDAMTITCNQLSTAELKKLRAAGLLPVLRIHGTNGHGKYHKHDAAKFAGFEN